MRAGSLFKLCALLVLLALAPVAATAQVDAAPVVTDVPEFDTTVTTDSLLGGLAVVGCGIFVRATIVTAGTQVATIIGAVACCTYAILDLI